MEVIFTDTSAVDRLLKDGEEAKLKGQFPVEATPVSEWSDDELIEHTLAGNTQSFEILVVRHNRRVFSIARHFFRTHETVEDIVQESFAKAYFSLTSYRRGASFEQWLAKIAVNNCYDELRRRKKRSESLITEISEDEQTWLENKLAGSAFEVHFSEGERDKAAEITRKLLEKMSIEDRIILLLLHGEDNSVREISQMLGWSEAKVKIRAFRARHAMRKALSRLNLSEKRKAGENLDQQL
ncbi:MAG: sigma-70 family RNA polymerase sigma factor [Acidobacteria bacterium]|nr:sigma-70 family RNA polymerase sigma factor [Acidobacteriota bacterium]